MIDTDYALFRKIKPVESVNMSLENKESDYDAQDDLFREQMNQSLMLYRQGKAAQKYREAQNLLGFL